MATSREQERVAEFQRLVEELRDFTEEMNPKECKFHEDMDERLTKYGEGTYVSDGQYEWMSAIYRRIIG